MFEYGVTPCPRVIHEYALDISVQAMQLSLLFLLTLYYFYTFNVLLLNTLIYTEYFHP